MKKSGCVCRARRDFLRGSLAAAAGAALPWPSGLEAGPRLSPGGTGGNLLVLHDTAGPFGWLSALQARMLENLLFRVADPTGSARSFEELKALPMQVIIRP